MRAVLLTGALLWPAASALADAAADMIASAEAAAPAAVAAGATIHGFDEAGAMTTLREGTNGWWCMPDNPASPGADPMCGDAAAMGWAQAWMARTDPPAGAPGLIYMLAGGSDASNTDPYATEPEAGNAWVETGPHIMVVGSPEMLAGYPSSPQPETGAPYVMWDGTPYAHLMIPIE